MSWIWFYKLVLGPVLLAQGKRLRCTVLRLPEAAGERIGFVAIEPAQKELHLLFLGDSTMAGVGVTHQSAALASQVCSIVASRLKRSVRWQLMAQTGLTTREALVFVNSQTLLPAEGMIVALGTNDVTSQRTPRHFLVDYEALLDAVSTRVGAQFVVLNGLPPLHLTPATPQPLRWYLGKYAHWLDEHLRLWIDQRPNTAYVSLQWASNPEEMAADRYHPGENQYRVWAGLVAETIIEMHMR